jgi:VWFA-related protein
VTVCALAAFDGNPSIEHAQGPAAPPQFRIGVEGVLLDVSVLDKERQPVSGLALRDFAVFEDGVPQLLRSVEEVWVPDEPVAGDLDWLLTPEVCRNERTAKGRLIVLVMDDESGVDPLLAAGAIAHAKAVARGILGRLLPSDLAAIVFPGGAGGGQDLTRDGVRLSDAIDRYLPDSSRNALRWRQYSSVLETLRLVVESLASDPSLRKTVFFISPGMALDFAKLGPTWAEPGSIDEAGQVRDLVQQLRQIFESARLANVNIHSVDVYGLPAAPGAANPFAANREFLQTLSENTGGVTIIDTNDPTPLVAQAMQATRGYYLLGYQPADQRRSGRLRRVDVRVNRPNVIVQARRGYFDGRPAASAPAGSGSPAMDALPKALAGLLPNADIPLQLAVTPLGTAGANAPGVLMVLGLQLPAPPSRVVDELKLATQLLSRGGEVVASTSQTVRIVLRPGSAGAVPFEVLSTIEAPPGRYAARIAVYSSKLGKAGSVYCDVDIPDFRRDALSLSGIILAADPGVTAAPRQSVEGLFSRVPTSVRLFQRGQSVAALVRIYQGGKRAPEPVRVSVRVADAEGSPVVDAQEWVGPNGFVAHRSVEWSTPVPVDTLDEGVYTLTLMVESAGQTSRRSLRFGIGSPGTPGRGTGR